MVAVGRIRAEIGIDGRRCWTLFDTGSRNTYVVPSVARLLTTVKLPLERKVALGGNVHDLHETCTLIGTVEGRSIDIDAYVIDSLGADESGRPIEILFGALAMQKWGIRPIPDEERLDLTHYPREFIEF
jgi:hypothetical protein